MWQASPFRVSPSSSSNEAPTLRVELRLVGRDHFLVEVVEYCLDQCEEHGPDDDAFYSIVAAIDTNIAFAGAAVFIALVEGHADEAHRRALSVACRQN